MAQTRESFSQAAIQEVLRKDWRRCKRQGPQHARWLDSMGLCPSVLCCVFCACRHTAGLIRLPTGNECWYHLGTANTLNPCSVLLGINSYQLGCPSCLLFCNVVVFGCCLSVQVDLASASSSSDTHPKAGKQHQSRDTTQLASS